MCIFNKIKKQSFILLIVLFISSSVIAAQPSLELTAKSALLLEYETGEILFEKNPHMELPPASMTKIMTMFLIAEAIEAERIKLDDKLVVSELAASMGGSQIWLEPGEEMYLEELMKAIAIVSANDASVAVAEYLFGTEEDFVKEMNKRAKELGLKNTYYYNTNGLPPDDSAVQGNYSSAYDLAILAREIIKYPKVLEWTSIWIDYLRNGKSVLNNTNRLIRHYVGADGLKTGYTEEAKYCVTCTAKRNGLRFISVIMGADNSKIRFDEAAKLLSYGFNTYQGLKIVEKGQVLQELLIKNGQEQLAKAIVREELIIPVKKGEEADITKKIELVENLRAPLKMSSKVGEIKVYKGNLLLKKTDIIIDRDIEKASVFQMTNRMIKQLIDGLVNIFK